MADCDRDTVMTRIVGVILAGGRSRRMGGRDKAMLPLAGRPLIAHVIERLAPQVAELAINSNAPAATFAAWGRRVLADDLPGQRGPLAGLHAAWRTYPGAAVVTVAVDLPFLPHDLVARLRRDWDGQRCRYATQDGRHIVAVLAPAALATELEAFLAHGETSLHAWLAQWGEPVAFLASAEADMNVNLNTPEELAQAESHPALRATTTKPERL
jgi:molybdopterin-guanine dinucleotide biosynthesis protein A